MRTILKAISLVAIAVCTTVVTSRAEAAPYTHDGFYLQINAGLGYLSSSADANGTSLKYSGLSVPSSLLLGGTVGPVVIGGGFITDYLPSPKGTYGGQSQTLTDLNLYLYAVGIFADIYPNPNSGLHFQPFLGFGGLQAEYQGRTSTNNPSGMVLSLGGGYDWWVGQEWSIGIMGRFLYAPLSVDGVGFSTISPALLATFTLH